MSASFTTSDLSQIRDKKISVSCLLWLLKPDMNIPLVKLLHKFCKCNQFFQFARLMTGQADRRETRSCKSINVSVSPFSLTPNSILGSDSAFWLELFLIIAVTGNIIIKFVNPILVRPHSLMKKNNYFFNFTLILFKIQRLIFSLS